MFQVWTNYLIYFLSQPGLVLLLRISLSMRVDQAMPNGVFAVLVESRCDVMEFNLYFILFTLRPQAKERPARSNLRLKRNNRRRMSTSNVRLLKKTIISRPLGCALDISL